MSQNHIYFNPNIIFDHDNGRIIGNIVPTTTTTTTQPIGELFNVRFIDYDGTILKEELVPSGSTATPPVVVADKDFLTFDVWNKDYDNVDHHTDIGAIYKIYDPDDQTYNTCHYLEVEMNDNYLQPTMYVTITDGDVVVDWGDGTTITASTTGSTAIQKATNYPTGGYYKIKIKGTGNYYLGVGSTPVFGTINAANPYGAFIVNAYISCSRINSKLFQFYNLENVVIANNVTSMVGNIFEGATANCVHLPSSIIHSGTDNSYTFRRSRIPIVTIGKNITSFGSEFFRDSIIKRLDLTAPTYNTLGLRFLQYAPIDYFWIPDNSITTLLSQTISYNNMTDAVYKIPDGFTTPNTDLFNGLNVKYLEIPSTYIGSSTITCFRYNNATFTWVFKPIIPPLITTNMLTNNLRSRIYVPDESVEAYKAAPVWSDMAGKIYPISQLA